MTQSSFSRRTLLGSAAAGSMLAMAGCRGPASQEPGTGTSSGASGVTGEVTHWDVWQSQTAFIENEIKLFNASGATIKRTKHQTGAYTNLLAVGARSGDLPDSRWLGNEPTLNVQIANGWLRPLNDQLDEEFIKSFPPYTFVEGNNVVEGKIYSAPFEGNTAPWAYLFINNKVFKDAGLVDASGAVLIPKTWDEVTQYAQQISDRGNGKVFGLGFGNAAFDLLSWWSTVFCTAESPSAGFGMDLRTGKFVMGTESLAGEFMEMMRSWKDKKLVFPSSMTIDDDTSKTYFARGDYGMTVGGVWNQPTWAADGFTDYSMTTLIGKTPEPKAKFYSGPGGATWVVNSKVKNLDATMAWFRQLYSVAAGERWTQEFSLGLSSHPEAVKLENIKDENFKSYVAAAEGRQIPGPSPAVRNPATASVLVDTVTPGVGAVLAGWYTGQINDLSGALKDLEKRMNDNQQKAIDAAVKKGAKVSGDDWVFADWNPLEPYKYDIEEYPSL